MVSLANNVAQFPRQLVVDIKLDDAPHYKGSIHDDAVARAAGYKAALIPGAFVYGHVSRLAVDAWGEAWARNGAMSARFRRPVYNGDVIVVSATALEDDGAFLRAEVSVRNEDDEEVATGWVALPHEPQRAPAIADLLVLPTPDEPQLVGIGDLDVGMRTFSRDRVLTPEDYAISRSAFAETHPLYDQRGLVHSGMLMRMAMGDTQSGLKFPSPVVLTEAEAQHYAVVNPGQRVKNSGRIVDVFERKGKHYFVSEEFTIVDDTVVAARFRRTSIYAYAEPAS